MSKRVCEILIGYCLAMRDCEYTQTYDNFLCVSMTYNEGAGGDKGEVTCEW